MDWSEAACRGEDMSLFFPEQGKYNPNVVKICNSCPIFEQCLEWAVHREFEGIWAGTNRDWRKAERTRRGITLLAPEIEVYGYGGTR